MFVIMGGRDQAFVRISLACSRVYYCRCTRKPKALRSGRPYSSGFHRTASVLQDLLLRDDTLQDTHAKHLKTCLSNLNYKTSCPDRQSRSDNRPIRNIEAACRTETEATPNPKQKTS